jgi:G3E family GTPase
MTTPANDKRVPVTVLTGFLGSGKTTLLNRILTENHGKRIAVIENEYGEIGVDQDLVIGAEEEIFEMNNGCICCTVRGDLIRILGNLMKRKDKFDYILIETTGMADPGPVAQTFFVDDELAAKTRIDGIVTMVDAKHVWLHIEESHEVQEQLAFADVIVLNKTDLVSPADLDQLEIKIRGINKAAKIYRSQNAVIEMDKVLNVGGFDLTRALEVDPKFMEAEYPFEYAGVFQLAAGTHEWHIGHHHDHEEHDHHHDHQHHDHDHEAHDHHDHSHADLPLLVVPLTEASRDALESIVKQATLTFSDAEMTLESGAAIPLNTLVHLPVGEGASTFHLTISQPGAYAIFAEHDPEHYDAHLHGAELVFSRAFRHEHSHEEDVTSVGIDIPGDLNVKKLNEWLGELLQTQGPDIYRMKGVLSIKGEEQRFVFQGVHMLFDGRPDRPWGTEKRSNKLIFIGRNLDRAKLTESFRQCLA